ncbi:MAG: ester cyclase [Polyangiales bacterium]
MENEQVISRFFEAWNAKDWVAWGALHSEDVRHAGPDHAQPIIGRDLVLAAHTGLGTVFPDFHYEVTHMFSSGPNVCVEWTLTGTHRGPLPGPGGRIEPTGREIDITGAFVFQIVQDQVADYTGHVDFLRLYRQVGAIQPLASDVGRSAQ